ncbi:MAG: hypothetical protein A2V90_05685 [Gammaproteobacteria bacterium RBG_16_57_12]|nr:MAG: hypothetical protein A2V90_05685 [Gammaproteobacteria bacterium RBG_16_57_12]
MKLFTVIKCWLSGDPAHQESTTSRTLELRFDLPYMRKADDAKLSLSVGDLRKEWHPYTKNSLLLIEHVIDYLDMLNHSQVPAQTRLKILEYILQMIYPHVVSVSQQHDVNESFPETEERRWGLASALSVIQQLAIGYKHLFIEDYHLPDKAYLQQRDRLCQSGVRILELTGIEQRIGALRYQKLSRQAWRECHQVFFALHQYEDVDEPRRLAGWFRLPLNASKQEGMATPKQLFIAIQLFGIVDTLSWPGRFIAALDSYLRRSESSIVIARDETGVLPGGYVVCYFDYAGPGQLAKTEQGRAGILMDIRPLLAQLERDNFYLAEQSPDERIKNLSPPLMQLHEHDRQIFLELLAKKLLMHHRVEERVYVGANREMDIYFGFMEGYRHIQGMNGASKDVARDGLPRSLNDILAGRTAALTEDSRHCRDAQWFVVDESRSGIRIRTNESRYTNPMGHGQLVVMECSAGQPTATQLGYVCRLHRPGKDELEVTIVRLSDAFECVGIQDEGMRQTGRAIPAYLFHADDVSHRLIFHSRQQRQPGEELIMQAKMAENGVVLGNIAFIQQEFTVFEAKLR